MKTRTMVCFAFLFPLASHACIICNEEVKKAIFDSMFYPNLGIMLLAFIVLALLVGILSTLTGKRYRTAISWYPDKQLLTPVPLTTTAAILGIGIGGFIDGIIFHQILQWHEMLSNKMPPVTLVAKSVNMFWDGIFHAFCLLVTLLGLALLWQLLWRKNIDKSGHLLVGGFLVGWALFNIVEGIIDHHLLKLHNVREVVANPTAWNFGFLAVSVAMLGVGVLIIGYRSKGKRRYK